MKVVSFFSRVYQIFIIPPWIIYEVKNSGENFNLIYAKPNIVTFSNMQFIVRHALYIKYCDKLLNNNKISLFS